MKKLDLWSQIVEKRMAVHIVCFWPEAINDQFFQLTNRLVQFKKIIKKKGNLEQNSRVIVNKYMN